MGKPFESELREIPRTINWATRETVAQFSDEMLRFPQIPLLVVGSGGSLSACHLLALLYQKTGAVAKAITPLDLFYSREIIGQSRTLLLSASGKNTDILFAFKTA